MTQKRLLVLYVYHVFQHRVDYFLKHGIFYDPDVDFVIISNDKSNSTQINPTYANVKTFFRDNVGYDFGGWSEALLTDALYENYDKFIFVNSSVMGPYVPSHVVGGKWTDLFLNGLDGRDNVKLFGSTINTIRNPLQMAHVQSYIFAMDKTTLKYLMECDIFSTSNYAKTFHDAIWQKEVLMSRKVIENGWNIGSFMPLYQGVDFTFREKQPDEYNIEFLDDVMYPAFRNVWWKDEDVVFVKGNR